MRTIIKLTFCVLVLLGFGFTSVAQQPTAANELLNAAFAKAKQEKKNVFVMFIASWCINCHAFKDEVLEHPITRAIFDDNYVMIYLTATEDAKNKHLENPGATELLAKYTKGTSTGIPFYVVLDPNGKLIGDSFFRPPGTDAKTPAENIGRPFMFYEIYAFIELLRKTSNLDSRGPLNYLAKYLSIMPQDYFKQP